MPAALSTRLRRAVTRRRVLAGAAVLVVLAGLVVWAAWPERPGYTTEDRMLTVSSGPQSTTPVRLDTTFYLPRGASAAHPAPAVLLGHGFGGTKASVATDAKDFANLGYAVLTWTAEGFGRSTGEIHLNSPDYEVRDAQRLLDWLASRPEIRTDAPGDPRVGVVGGSYGGGLALLLAGYDRRVDAIVPMITWNDLARSFLPESTGGVPVDGVFKKGWAGLFFGGGASAGVDLGGLAGSRAGAGTSNQGPAGTLPDGLAGLVTNPACGRFAADVCAAYQRIATAGRADPDAVALLRRSSPSTVLDRISAPTLLIQGTADSLFPLSEADANARGIAANGTPVRVAWFTGGHDGGAGPKTDQNRLRFLTAQWLDHYVRGNGAAPADSFTYSFITGFDAVDRGLVSSGYSTPDYVGLGGQRSSTVTLSGPPQPVANPPAGNPAPGGELSSIGGLGGVSGFSDIVGSTSELPGQFGAYTSAPLESTVDLVGAPTVRIRAASPTGEAVLFVKLYDVDQRGGMSVVGGLAPVRLTGLPAAITDAPPASVTLPGAVVRLESGHRLMLTIATADQGYATPNAPTVYTVALGDGTGATLTLPSLTGTPIPNPSVVWRYVLAGLILAVLVGLGVVLVVARRRRHASRRAVVPEHADTPLVVRGLRKAYGDGFVAVSTVDFTVERGQVVGLLGPNGAGKTTTLRVLMGLTRPTGGEILVFGYPLVAGAPVLSRLGALVEGPGFLPHLSGLENLRSYWRASGRPEADARFADAMDIAGLGAAIHRKVRKYSHGMKQRLAIAQAMLGLPELLVLDEPTDGLDPPQIAEMRRVLQRYATDGRAVLVSSHLLAEVEQTCTHVVVVHKGEIVASGPVDDIVGDSPTVQLDVSDVDTASAVLGTLDGVRSVRTDNGGLIVDIDGRPRASVVEALVRAGVGVDRVVPRRRLEDAFLALVGESTTGGGDR